MKDIITVRLAVDPITGVIAAFAPFAMIAKQRFRNGIYDDEPKVIAQFLPGEREARFEAEWIDDGWTFGKRVADG